MVQDAEQLSQLVAAHDAVFLLTDTRESRWLPTLLCAAESKAAITAALGFDGLVVMRHGVPPLSQTPTPSTAAAPTAVAAAAAADSTLGAHPGDAAQPRPTAQAPQHHQAQATTSAAQQPQHASCPQPHAARLGCYFCNDVVAPLNSTVDRTLDQQCTVARPGLAPIAGALAVELLAALLQHPDGLHAPTLGPGGALGAVPHMIRAQLAGFSQVGCWGVVMVAMHAPHPFRTAMQPCHCLLAGSCGVCEVDCVAGDVMAYGPAC